MMFVFSGAFQLYDTDKSDSISKDEMHKIVTVKGINNVLAHKLPQKFS